MSEFGSVVSGLKLPKAISIGCVWVTSTIVVVMWLGWMDPPWMVTSRQREELEIAKERERISERRAEDAERAILLLRYQMDESRAERAQIKAKLDEMAMVLYSMERRTR